MTMPEETPPLHVWTKFRGLVVCGACGLVKNARNATKRCRGATGVWLRGEPTAGTAPVSTECVWVEE